MTNRPSLACGPPVASPLLAYAKCQGRYHLFVPKSVPTTQREAHPDVANCPQSADGARRGDSSTNHFGGRASAAEQPPAQFTLLRWFFQTGNHFAESARSG